MLSTGRRNDRVALHQTSSHMMSPVTLAKPARQAGSVIDTPIATRGRSRAVIVIVALAAVLGALFLLSLVLGSVWIPVDEVVNVLRGSDLARRTAYAVIHDV